ncbi:MAG: helix-turn-helix domain-containing protein [Pyrinomonadaceae bacterium]
MGRSLKIRKPRVNQQRKLEESLRDDLAPQQLRRAQAILLYGEGWAGIDIAAALHAHPATIYQDLRHFAAQGLQCLSATTRRGRPPTFTAAQEQLVWQLMDSSPIEQGLPFARWSLRRLRDYLIKERVVARVSRETVRQWLKKGASTSPACGAKSSAATRNPSPS